MEKIKGDVAEGMVETVTACMNRVRIIPSYMQCFMEFLDRGTDHDKALKSRMTEISIDSENLALEMDELIDSIKVMHVEPADLSPNRRHHERFVVEGSGTITGKSIPETPYILKDISLKGAGIISNHPPELSGSVEMLIVSPAIKYPVYKKARVVWNKKIDDNMWESGLDLGEDKIDNFQFVVMGK